MKKKILSMLGALVPSIAIIFLQYVVVIGCAFFAMSIAAHNYVSGGFEQFLSDYIELISTTGYYGIETACYGLVALIAFVPWYYFAFVKHSRYDVVDGIVTKKAKRRLTDSVGSMVLGLAFFVVGLQYFSTYLISAMGTLFPAWMLAYEEMFETVGLTAGSITLVLVIYSVILAPIAEEIIYRGLTLAYAKRGVSFWVANLFQAFLFAVMHMNIIQGTYAFILALFLGLIVHKSGRLTYGIIIHLVFNFFGTLLSGFVLVGETMLQVFTIVFGSLVFIYFGFKLMYDHIPQEE